MSPSKHPQAAAGRDADSSSHPFDDALAAYALDALDRDEAGFLKRHLAECPRCRAEVATLRESTVALATSVPQRDAPAGLRERILAAARQEAPPRRASRGRSLGWIAAAASLVVAAGLGATLFQSRADQRGLRERIARADSLLNARARDVAVRDSLLARVLGPEVETITLASTGAAPSMRLFWDRARGVMVVSARRLPPPSAGRTYQLWGIGADGKPVGLGTFATDAQGAAVVTMAVSGDARFGVSAVTDEPAGGSPQPTTTPFLVGTWPTAAR